MCMCVYVRIYMSVCSELIEETGRPPGLIFGMCGYFWPGSESSSLRKKFTHLTELRRNCHIFEGVKNQINAEIETRKLNTI